MNISDYLKDKQIEFKSDGSLFGLPILESMQQKRCPICGNKIYLMLNNKMYYCRSKKHKSYVVSREKVDKAAN